MKRKDDAGLARIVDMHFSKREVPAPYIDEVNAGICWGLSKTSDPASPPTWEDVHVVDLQAIRAGEDPSGAHIWHNADSTLGACTSDWLRNPRHTCMGFFSAMCYDGAAPTGKAYVRLLLEFAKVKECDWARHMLAALWSSDFLDADRDDLVPVS